jgi:hypothetical protein
MKDQRYNHVEIYECNQNGIQRISAIFYIHGLHGTGFSGIVLRVFYHTGSIDIRDDRIDIYEQKQKQGRLLFSVSRAILDAIVTETYLQKTDVISHYPGFKGAEALYYDTDAAYHLALMCGKEEGMRNPLPAECKAPDFDKEAWNKRKIKEGRRAHLLSLIRAIGDRPVQGETYAHWKARTGREWGDIVLGAGRLVYNIPDDREWDAETGWRMLPSVRERVKHAWQEVRQRKADSMTDS